MIIRKYTAGALVTAFLFTLISAAGAIYDSSTPLGHGETIRVYVEFADGKNRGMYDPKTHSKGYPDEEYDATTAMVINWHQLPGRGEQPSALVEYRKVHPHATNWKREKGELFDFWFREEMIGRVLLTDLEPGSVYEFTVRGGEETFRFRTMPESLDDRSVKIAMAADHQSPHWSQVAHDNAKMVALNEPDMFVVVGDYVNDEGRITVENADRWARYLDVLYAVDDGYFLYDKEIDDQVFENLIIPHVTVLGNHETGERNHVRWPADLYRQPSRAEYPTFVPAKWIELLFHWPYKSEGFYSEYNPDHPNVESESVPRSFGYGGFGKLSFSDYLLFIALDNSQNWAGEPDASLRDWEGNLITDKWPWFKDNHADIRQDLWLENLLEPEGQPSAGETYDYILPVWHRGLFGTARLNMSYKNRSLLKYWLPILYRNGAKLIKEAHDHNFTRTVPMSVYHDQPDDTYLEKIAYRPHTWELSGQFDVDYTDNFFSVNVLKSTETNEIIGWEYDGNYITHNKSGMISIGHGGWAAGRRNPGEWGGGNAGLWFVEESKGGASFGGEKSFHMTFLHLSNDGLKVEAYHPDQLANFENANEPVPIHRFRWDSDKRMWYAFDVETGKWGNYHRDDLMQAVH